jgi:hypothetical protein
MGIIFFSTIALFSVSFLYHSLLEGRAGREKLDSDISDRAALK